MSTAATLLSGALAGGADGLSSRDCWICLAYLYSGAVQTGVSVAGVTYTGSEPNVVATVSVVTGNSYTITPGPTENGAYLVNGTQQIELETSPVSITAQGSTILFAEGDDFIAVGAALTATIITAGTSSVSATQLAAAMANGYDGLSNGDIKRCIAAIINGY